MGCMFKRRWVQLEALEWCTKVDNNIVWSVGQLPPPNNDAHRCITVGGYRNFESLVDYPLRTVRPIYRTGVMLPSRCCILYIFFSTNISTKYFKHTAHSPFFSSKCRLFHNASFFGYCIIHILHTGVLKFKCKIPVPKGYSTLLCRVQRLYKWQNLSKYEMGRQWNEAVPRLRMSGAMPSLSLMRQ
jgi:hypothetical protein